MSKFQKKSHCENTPKMNLGDENLPKELINEIRTVIVGIIVQIHMTNKIIARLKKTAVGQREKWRLVCRCTCNYQL